MSKSTLSIIVLTFNNYTELVKTLKSIPEVHKKSIFIVNGGNCEKTSALIDSEYNGVSEKDNGIADAFSKGVLKANGNLIHFLNSGDVLYDATFYDQVVEHFDEDKDVYYIYSNILYKHLKYGNLIIRPDLKAVKNMAFGMPFSHPGLVVKKEVFDKIGGFDGQFKIGMDYDFILRMLKNHYRGKYLDVVSVEMDGSGVSSKKPIQSTLENLKSLRKNDSLGGVEILIIVGRLARTMTKNFLVQIGLEALIIKFYKVNSSSK